ncbi:hypothetical protein [Lichenifustis flavocetrariae]|uniref:Uncharacterized protein n=1 Tax=Lichenifustis flavocetrariae TaxID=2949735 RepID=A0AA42CNW9_9HYPH|nr:hypothetical protein [Lichenifustis flavocetrariae]MCW6509815.1 hypothetical protein [Lichenifustis flavocetrariae]
MTDIHRIVGTLGLILAPLMWGGVVHAGDSSGNVINSDGEGVVQTALVGGGLLLWRPEMRIQLFAPATQMQVFEFGSMAGAAADELRIGEARIASAYLGILRYGEWPNVKRRPDDAINAAYEILNEPVTCRTAVARRPCKAVERYAQYEDELAKVDQRGGNGRGDPRRRLRMWGESKGRQAVAVALGNIHELERVDPKFLGFDLWTDFQVFGGARSASTGADPGTVVRVDSLGSGSSWVDLSYSASPYSIAILRIERPWFDRGVFSRYVWSTGKSGWLHRESSLADGVTCDLPLGCIPEWLIVSRKQGVGEVEYSLVGTVSDVSPSVPAAKYDQKSLGVEQVSRSSSFDELLNRLRDGSY